MTLIAQIAINRATWKPDDRHMEQVSHFRCALGFARALRDRSSSTTIVTTKQEYVSFSA
jgi:hypothetical protein